MHSSWTHSSAARFIRNSRIILVFVHQLGGTWMLLKEFLLQICYTCSTSSTHGAVVSHSFAVQISLNPKCVRVIDDVIRSALVWSDAAWRRGDVALL